MDISQNKTYSLSLHIIDLIGTSVQLTFRKNIGKFTTTCMDRFCLNLLIYFARKQAIETALLLLLRKVIKKTVSTKQRDRTFITV